MQTLASSSSSRKRRVITHNAVQVVIKSRAQDKATSICRRGMSLMTRSVYTHLSSVRWHMVPASPMRTMVAHRASLVVDSPVQRCKLQRNSGTATPLLAQTLVVRSRSAQFLGTTSLVPKSRSDQTTRPIACLVACPTTHQPG